MCGSTRKGAEGLASHRPTPHVAVMFLLPVCCIHAAMSALSRLPARPPACRPRSTFIAARERCSCTREPSWEEQRGPRAIVDALEPWRLPLAAIVCNQAPLRRRQLSREKESRAPSRVRAVELRARQRAPLPFGGHRTGKRRIQDPSRDIETDRGCGRWPVHRSTPLPPHV